MGKSCCPINCTIAFDFLLNLTFYRLKKAKEREVHKCLLKCLFVIYLHFYCNKYF